jgi:hypothetical protein
MPQVLGTIWHIGLNQTYSPLNRLESQGDITGVTQEQEKLPPQILVDVGRTRCFEEGVLKSRLVCSEARFWFPALS